MIDDTNSAVARLRDRSGGLGLNISRERLRLHSMSDLQNSPKGDERIRLLRSVGKALVRALGLG